MKILSGKIFAHFDRENEKCQEKTIISEQICLRIEVSSYKVVESTCSSKYYFTHYCPIIHSCSSFTLSSVGKYAFLIYSLILHWYVQYVLELYQVYTMLFLTISCYFLRVHMLYAMTRKRQILVTNVRWLLSMDYLW